MGIFTSQKRSYQSPFNLYLGILSFGEKSHDFAFRIS